MHRFLLFLLQALAGGALAHYRVESGAFYGFDLARYFPYNLLRTFHLQLAIFWIATAWVAGGLFLAPIVGGAEPRGQRAGVLALLAALAVVVFGSLGGEWLGINDRLGSLWFWLGHQGSEYLDLGRFWQLLLAAGLAGWLVLMYRALPFGTLFSVDPQKKIILSLEPQGEIFLTRLRYFFVLSLLWYMVKASDVKPGNKLVKPSGMSGGDIFFRGSHVLPLESIAKKYAHDRKAFRERGLSHGGRVVEYGDTAIELFPFQKIPVTVILWLADEEWEARADVLFDSTALKHLPIDLLWSIAMMSVLIFL